MPALRRQSLFLFSSTERPLHALPASAVCFWALMWRAAAAGQVIAGICLAVWLINIPRFNDPLHGGWVRGWPAAKAPSVRLCAPLTLH